MGELRVRMLDGAGDVSAALQALDAVRVCVAVAPGAPPSVAGAAGAAVALLGRMFAHVEVAGDAELPDNPWAARTVSGVLDAICHIRPHPARQPHQVIRVGIGDVASVDLGVGGSAYTAVIGSGRQHIDHAEISAAGHALGVHAAVALAAGEVLKRALEPVGFVAVPVTDQLVWNLIDYRRPRLVPGPPARGVAGSVGWCRLDRRLGRRRAGNVDRHRRQDHDRGPGGLRRPT